MSFPKIKIEVKMSANIPFEIQEEIIKRVLDIKPLIRFRSVSKQWKTLIDSSEFITHHTFNHTPSLNHLLVRYNEADEYKYFSVVDDDSFPHQKFSPYVPPTVKLVNHIWMLDCSHGLVCLYGTSVVLGKIIIVVWNPSIRKSVGIALSGGLFTALGFGVCPKTFEPKIVKITPSYQKTNNMDRKWKAEVFTITSGVWRSIPIDILPHQNNVLIRVSFNQVLIDGVIYWIVSEPGNGYIVSFDLTSEEFEKIKLPENLEREFLSIAKVNESLVLLECDEFEMILDVWKMIKNGDSNFLFEKLYTLSCLADDGCEIYDITGSGKNGQPIRVHVCESGDSAIAKLEAYDSSTKSNINLGINVTTNIELASPIMITTYTESLLLLNHSDSIIHG